MYRVAMWEAASGVVGVQLIMLLGVQLTWLTVTEVAPPVERVKVPLELVCPRAI